MPTQILSLRWPTAVASLVLLSAVAGCEKVKAHDLAMVAQSAPAPALMAAASKT